MLSKALYHTYPPDILPKKLFSTRVSTNYCNERHLRRDYIGDYVTYDEQAEHDQTLNDLPCTVQLKLRKNIRVMLNKNISTQLCNGRQGTVVCLCSPMKAIFIDAIADLDIQICLDILAGKISPEYVVDKIKSEYVTYNKEDKPSSDGY